MKATTLFAILVCLALNNSAMAQESSTSLEAAIPKSQAAASGIRVALIKPILSGNGLENVGLRNSRFEDSMGLSLGYSDLSVGELGYTASFNFINQKILSDNFVFAKNGQMVRADLNMGTSLNSTYSVKAGLNISKFTSIATAEIEPIIGAQASVGMQATRNLGFELGYVMMSQQVYTTKGMISQSGFELGVTGTF